MSLIPLRHCDEAIEEHKGEVVRKAFRIALDGLIEGLRGDAVETRKTMT